MRDGSFTVQQIFTDDGQNEFEGVAAAAICRSTPRWQLFGNVSYAGPNTSRTRSPPSPSQEDQLGLAVRGTPISGIPDRLSTFGVDDDHHDLFLPHDELNVRFEGHDAATGTRPSMASGP